LKKGKGLGRRKLGDEVQSSIVRQKKKGGEREEEGTFKLDDKAENQPTGAHRRSGLRGMD